MKPKKFSEYDFHLNALCKFFSGCLCLWYFRIHDKQLDNMKWSNASQGSRDFLFIISFYPKNGHISRNLAHVKRYAFCCSLRSRNTIKIEFTKIRLKFICTEDLFCDTFCAFTVFYGDAFGSFCRDSLNGFHYANNYVIILTVPNFSPWWTNMLFNLFSQFLDKSNPKLPYQSLVAVTPQHDYR